MSFSLGLTALTAYYILIEDAKGNVYTHQYTTGAGGAFTVDTALYPEGLFNEYAGTFELTIKNALTDTTVVSFTVSATTYDCCKFSIYSSDAV